VFVRMCCMYVCTYALTYLCVMSMQVFVVHVCMCVRLLIRTNSCACVYVCMYVCMYGLMRLCLMMFCLFCLQLNHENVVNVCEVVVGNDMDSVFMVMEYIEHDLKVHSRMYLCDF
jgi:hypothetical protein